MFGASSAIYNGRTIGAGTLKQAFNNVLVLPVRVFMKNRIPPRRQSTRWRVDFPIRALNLKSDSLHQGLDENPHANSERDVVIRESVGPTILELLHG